MTVDSQITIGNFNFYKSGSAIEYLNRWESAWSPKKSGHYTQALSDDGGQKVLIGGVLGAAAIIILVFYAQLGYF